MPWNFFLIYVGSVMYFMSYSLEARRPWRGRAARARCRDRVRMRRGAACSLLRRLRAGCRDAAQRWMSAA